jgi:hypothetical protein
MEVITITFKITSASKRKEEIKLAMDPHLPCEIKSAKLFKKGYDDMDYGYGDSDLTFADGVKVTIEKP